MALWGHSSIGAALGAAVRHALAGREPRPGSPGPDGPAGRRAPRSRHPGEAPFIRPGQWGEVRIQISDRFGDEPLVGDDGRTRLVLRDLYKHVLILGGSGSGKTYTALNQLVREIFRSTHIPDGPERERKKPGALFIEGKGDYAIKARRLCQRYGRIDDLVLVGPQHGFSFDPFGDPTENPVDKAGKLLTLMLALSEGQKSQDPFWENNAYLLFLNIFRLHEALCAAAGAQAPPEPGGGAPKQAPAKAPEPMSFRMLSLMLSDRGPARNQAAISAWQANCEAQEKTYDAELEAFRGAHLALQATLDRWIEAIFASADAAAAGGPPAPAREEMESLVRLAMGHGLDGAVGGGAPAGEWPGDEGEPEAGEGPEGQGRSMTPVWADIARVARDYLTNHPQWGPNNAVPEIHRLQGEMEDQLELAREHAQAIIDACGDDPRHASLASALREGMAAFAAWAQSAGRVAEAMQRWRNALSRRVAPEYGLLQQMLQDYRALREAQGKGPGDRDEVIEYFAGNYLSVANEKTAGSVAMTAAQLVVRMAAPPYDQMFRPGGEFTLYDIIERGRVVALDMPFARYREAARLTSILLKCDFFRAVLSRKAMRMQMDRPVFFVVDELATVATKGQWTGEPGFLDKCREYNCGCLLATQSVPMLKNIYTDAEVDGVLTNTQTRVYLRNDDETTNKRASESSGRYHRATGSPTASQLEISGAQSMMGTDHAHIHFQEDYWLRTEDFRRFEVGECLLILPPEFGNRMIRRVILEGEPLGAVCPACGQMAVDTERRPQSCPRCGWSGDRDLDSEFFPVHIGGVSHGAPGGRGNGGAA